MGKKNDTAKTVGFIFFAMLAAKLLGQIREIVIAGTYGTAWQADAYLAASQIPTNFFDMILGSAVSAAFIPVFNKFMQENGEKRAKRFAGSFFNTVFLIGLFLTLLGEIFAPFIIAKFTPGLGGEAAVLAVKLLRIMFPMIIFIGDAYTFVGLLQSMGEYNLPAVMSMVSSGICIIYLLTLERRFGITGLAVSLLLGWLLQFVFLLPSTLKKGFTFQFVIADSGLKEVAALALPVLIGTWVQPINVMVNTMLASKVSGGVSAINYANKLYIIAAGIFAMSVTNYIFPKLSRLSIDESDTENWYNLLVSSLKTVILVVTPITVVFLTESSEIIRVIYQRGEFNEKSVAATGGALLFYSVGILPYALQEVMYKAFYSKRNSVTPMFIALYGIIANVILSLVFSRFLGIKGLALAASVSVLTVFAVSFYIVMRNRKVQGLYKDVLKIFVSGAVSAAVILVVKKLLILGVGLETFISRFLVLCISAFVGCAIYGISVLAAGVPEVTGIVGKALSKIKK